MRNPPDLSWALVAFASVAACTHSEPGEDFPEAPCCEPRPSSGTAVVVLTDQTLDAHTGRLWPELFRLEGLSFSALDVRDAAVEIPSSVQVAFVPAFPVSSDVAAALDAFVERGGTLIVARPEENLAETLGVSLSEDAFDGRWLAIDATDPFAAGIDPGPIRLHDAPVPLVATGARVVAYASQTPGAVGRVPAVTAHRRGNGVAIAMAFDPLRAVVALRQGNPEWVGRRTNNMVLGYRPDQMFSRTDATGTLLESWNGTDDGTGTYSRNDVPQADELSAFLVQLAVRATEAALPIARIDRMPADHDSVLVLTADHHPGENNSLTEGVLNPIERHGGTDSLYLWSPLYVANSVVESWSARGHDVGIHFDFNGIPQSYAAYDQVVRDALLEFAGTHPSVPTPTTTRSHNLFWLQVDENDLPDPIAHARIYHQTGVELDTSWSSLPRTYGYMTGSGLPMRFIDVEAAESLNVYQQATQFQDSAQMSLLPYSMGWDGAQFGEQILRALENAKSRYHTGVAALIHTNTFSDAFPNFDYRNWGPESLDELLGRVAASGTALWNAAEWLRFHQARGSAVITTLGFDGELLQLEVSHDARVPLRVRIPANHRRVTEVLVNGTSVSVTVTQYRDASSLEIPLPAGTHAVDVAFAR